jgi:uncharacterized membrane protein
MAVAVVPQAKRHHPLADAIRESTRLELFSIAVMFAFFILVTVAYLISVATHNAALMMQVSKAGTLIMYIMCVWHSLHVKGVRQTVAFFTLSWIITFVAEFLGSNFGLIFGSYDYTSAVGPLLGGVSLAVPFNWSILQYAALMLVDWLLGLGGEGRGVAWYGKVLWSALIALTAGFILTAAALMCDPAYVSGVWAQVTGTPPWWWWEGGSYLPELQVWQGSGGIPVQNFVGWTATTFLVVFVFNLFFQVKNEATGKLVGVVPLLIYSYLYYCPALVLAVMSWHDPGLQQALLIGTFAMGPVIMFGVVKFAKDFWTPPSQ